MKYALYYPSLYIGNPTFLCNSLLFWDTITCIVPYKEYYKDITFRPYQEDEEVAYLLQQAHERYVLQHAPTDEEKMSTHQEIERLITREPPPWLKPENLPKYEQYSIASDKLFDDTRELLLKSQWAMSTPDEKNLIISYPAALIVMSILVGNCSSEELIPITDREEDFEAANNLMVEACRGDCGLCFTEIWRQGSYYPTPRPGLWDKYRNISKNLLIKTLHQIKIKDTNPRLLKKVLEARDKPEIEGHRQTFRDQIDKYLKNLRKAKSPLCQYRWDTYPVIN